MVMYKAGSVRFKTQLAKLTGKCQLICEGRKREREKTTTYISQKFATHHSLSSILKADATAQLVRLWG